MVTVKIKETTPQAKALIAMLKTLSFVEIEPKGLSRPAVKTRKVAKKQSPYNENFVKMINDAEKRGNYKVVKPTDLWNSL